MRLSTCMPTCGQSQCWVKKGPRASCQGLKSDLDTKMQDRAEQADQADQADQAIVFFCVLTSSNHCRYCSLPWGRWRKGVEQFHSEHCITQHQFPPKVSIGWLQRTLGDWTNDWVQPQLPHLPIALPSWTGGHPKLELKGTETHKSKTSTCWENWQHDFFLKLWRMRLAAFYTSPGFALST